MDFKLKPKCPSIDPASAQTGQGQGHQKGQNCFFTIKSLNIVLWTSNLNQNVHLSILLRIKVKVKVTKKVKIVFSP